MPWPTRVPGVVSPARAWTPRSRWLTPEARTARRASEHSPGRNVPGRTLPGMKSLLLTAVSVAATLSLALSGCSSDDRPTGASTDEPGGAGPSGQADPFSKVVKYAECLQKEGLHVKIKPGDGFSLPRNYDPKVKEAAEAACRSVAPPGMYAKPSAEELDRYVKIAQCLREAGVKVKDPTEDHPQLQIDQVAPDNLRQLTDACEQKVGNGGST
jgi:hypothetical protein